MRRRRFIALLGGVAATWPLAARAAVPIFLIYGAETPSRSRAEMDALAAVPGVRTERLPRGKLSVHEEFPDEVASFVGPFLSN